MNNYKKLLLVIGVTLFCILITSYHFRSTINQVTNPRHVSTTNRPKNSNLKFVSLQVKKYQNALPVAKKTTTRTRQFTPTPATTGQTTPQVTVSNSVIPRQPETLDLSLRQRILDGAVTLPRPRVQQVNCARLFNGSEKDLQKAFDLAKLPNQPSSFLSQDELNNMTSDCDAFRRRRQYIWSSLSSVEDDFPLAFTLVTYHDPGVVERLLRAVYRPQNYYCIHVDSKSPDDFHQTMVKLASCFPNVLVAATRAEVHWGYIGVLQAELICIRELLKKKKWKYILNLTGEEFPLKTNLDIVNALKVYDGANEISNLPSKQWEVRWQYVHNHIDYRTSVRKKPPPHNITIHKGDVHFVLSRDFAEFAVTDERARDLTEWLADAFCPEELFFSSLQFNPQLKAPGTYNGDMKGRITGTAISRHKIWSYDNLKCHGTWRRNICVFGIEALKSLKEDEHAFFLNKIVRSFQPMTYDCLEELHFNRTLQDYTTNRYQNLTFYAEQFFVGHHF